jgi:hypothetical protein
MMAAASVSSAKPHSCPSGRLSSATSIPALVSPFAAVSQLPDSPPSLARVFSRRTSSAAAFELPPPADPVKSAIWDIDCPTLQSKLVAFGLGATLEAPPMPKAPSAIPFDDATPLHCSASSLTEAAAPAAEEAAPSTPSVAAAAADAADAPPPAPVTLAAAPASSAGSKLDGALAGAATVAADVTTKVLDVSVSAMDKATLVAADLGLGVKEQAQVVISDYKEFFAEEVASGRWDRFLARFRGSKGGQQAGSSAGGEAAAAASPPAAVPAAATAMI